MTLIRQLHLSHSLLLINISHLWWTLMYFLTFFFLFKVIFMGISQQTVLNQGYYRSYKVTWASLISVEEGWYAEPCLPPASSLKTLWTSHLHKWYKFYLDGFLNGFDHFKMLKIVLTRTHWPWTLSFFDREIVAPWLRSVNPAGEHSAWCFTKSNTIFKQSSSIWKGWNLGKECEETRGSVILNPHLRNCFISLRAVFCICRNTRGF